MPEDLDGAGQNLADDPERMPPRAALSDAEKALQAKYEMVRQKKAAKAAAAALAAAGAGSAGGGASAAASSGVPTTVVTVSKEKLAKVGKGKAKRKGKAVVEDDPQARALAAAARVMEKEAEKREAERLSAKRAEEQRAANKAKAKEALEAKKRKYMDGVTDEDVGLPPAEESKRPRVAGDAGDAAGAGASEDQGGALAGDGAAAEVGANPTTIYVGDIPIDTQRGELEDLFKQFGAIDEIRPIPGKRFAFVKFATVKAAQNAIATMDGERALGANLRVSKATVESRKDGEGDAGGAKRAPRPIIPDQSDDAPRDASSAGVPAAAPAPVDAPEESTGRRLVSYGDFL